MLSLVAIAVAHNQTDTSFSALEIASDYCCWSMIDHLLYFFYNNNYHVSTPSYCIVITYDLCEIRAYLCVLYRNHISDIEEYIIIVFMTSLIL